MKLYCAWSSFLQNWDRRIINKIYYCYYYLIKNGNGEGGGKEKEKEKKKKEKKGGGGRGLVGRQSEGLGGVVWVYKIGLK